MWQFIKNNSFVIGALTGSVAAYLLGLLVGYWRREKRWVGFSVTSRMIVERGHPDLSLKYKDRAIERLHSHTVTIRNIGNRPLTKQPVRIESAQGGELVAYELDKPRGANFEAAKSDDQTLLVNCDLLNPGEVFIVGLTVVNSPDGELAVTARGENLVCKQISERIDTADLIQTLASTSAVTRVVFELTRALLPK
jgi:hypothetical protein